MADRKSYDVVVLGGGVNGAGTARDCAMRGLSVLLLEKRDLASGASGASSGMIHGGIRYMLSDRKVTELACRDAGYIRRIAPHLVFRIPFLMPFASRAEEASLAERAAWYATEVYVGTYDLYQPLKGGKPSTRLTPAEMYALEPSLRPGLGGAVTLDEWGIDGQRLCLLNALSAEAHGAEVRTWTEATELVREGGRAVAVRWRDLVTGEHGEARAGAVLNATGAWSPHWGRLNGVEVPMRPGKGVHLSLDRRFSNYGIICRAVDGRQMFLMPHEDESIIGTTDDDFYGDPDDLEATSDEVAYLLEGVESLVPSVRRARVTRAWSGVRTTLYEYGKTEDALSREHQLLDHAPEGAEGLFSFVGGKLASYRAQSEEITDRLLSFLGKAPRPCRTHEEPLPGGDAVADAHELARRHGVGEGAVRRLVYRHGSRAREVLLLADDDPRLKLVVCRDEGILAAEVVFIARHEKVRRLEDLRRRCRLGIAGCGGLDCARLGAQLVAHELDWDGDRLRAELHQLLEVNWRERRAVLDGFQLSQEELLRAVHRGLGEV
ncbi:MAG TPA: glycerol-3-phosphate dehydrogenase/oxidase [Anaeromyxobacteraceae bacterium]|nr:glycerol-3-phosphate dehydrogenase/oxidase [Anaeromyxobacteraceae bacterium]